MLEHGWLQRRAREIDAEAEKWPEWMKKAVRPGANEDHAQAVRRDPADSVARTQREPNSR